MKPRHVLRLTPTSESRFFKLIGHGDWLEYSMAYDLDQVIAMARKAGYRVKYMHGLYCRAFKLRHKTTNKQVVPKFTQWKVY